MTNHLTNWRAPGAAEPHAPDVFELINRLPEVEMGHEEHKTLAAVQEIVGSLLDICEQLEQELSLQWSVYETPTLLRQLRGIISKARGMRGDEP